MNKLEARVRQLRAHAGAQRAAQRRATGRKDPVRVAGVAPVGSTLRRTASAPRLDDKGRFDARVAPTGQPPLVQIMMSPPGAPAILTVRRLR